MHLQADKDLYSKFKEEQNQIELNYNMDDGRNDGKADKKNDEGSKVPIKCVEFCNLLCNLADCEYKQENLDILVTLIQIMKIMGR